MSPLEVPFWASTAPYVERILWPGDQLQEVASLQHRYLSTYIFVYYSIHMCWLLSYIQAHIIGEIAFLLTGIEPLMWETSLGSLHFLWYWDATEFYFLWV